MTETLLTGSSVADRFVDAGAQLAGVAPAVARAARRLVLASSEGEQYVLGRSTLNNDGWPLQLCLSSCRSGRRARLLGDPTGLLGAGSREGSQARVVRAVQAARHLMEVACCEGLSRACGDMVDRLLPAGGVTKASMAGPLWLAVGLGCPGAGFYVNARGGPMSEWWERVASCLEHAVPGEDAMHVLRAVAPHAWPASVGAEGESSGATRVKLYWRLRQAARLKDFGLALLLDLRLAEFLRAVLNNRTVPTTGLVFSASFDGANGRLRDVKVDVCAHCLGLSPDEWLGVIDRLVVTNGLADVGAAPLLGSGAADVALLGFGVERTGEARLNLYLKPMPA